jgi:hypothetical protein
MVVGEMRTRGARIAAALAGAALAGCGAAAPPAQKPEAAPFADLRVLRTTAAPAAFARFGVRPTVDTVAEPVSRVVATVDTASFDRVRAALGRGELPDPDAVRVEEVVQAFARPVGGEAFEGFRVAAARFASPARPGYDVLALSISNGPDEARDATVEVAFDPAVVARYRLIGYEREAGTAASTTVPAGAARTLLYEVQARVEALGTLRLAGGPARLPLRAARRPWREAEAWARQAWRAAALAEKLRGGWWVRGLTYDRLTELDGADDDLGRLIAEARRLDRRDDPFAAEPAAAGFDEVPLRGGSR